MEKSINCETLMSVLNKMLNKTILHADYEIEEIKDKVWLITGTAETDNNDKLPFKVVFKIVEKANCPVDPDTGRREYDAYKSNFGTLLTDALRWPECYHAEINIDETETQLWLEYIDGVTGNGLTVDMFERTAYEIGRFQGKLYAEQPPVLQTIPNLSKPDIKKGYYYLNRTPERYDYIRSENGEIPKHICKMFIDMDENAELWWCRIERLPLVLCNRDVWMDNIFYSDGNIILIDWDTIGWGYLGEGIANLIVDEADYNYMHDRYHRCVPAYYKGFSEYADITEFSDTCIFEMALLMYGYRLVGWYIDASKANLDWAKELNLNTMQKIYEMRKLT